MHGGNLSRHGLNSDSAPRRGRTAHGSTLQFEYGGRRFRRSADRVCVHSQLGSGWRNLHRLRIEHDGGSGSTGSRQLVDLAGD